MQKCMVVFNFTTIITYDIIQLRMWSHGKETSI